MYFLNSVSITIGYDRIAAMRLRTAAINPCDESQRDLTSIGGHVAQSSIAIHVRSNAISDSIALLSTLRLYCDKFASVLAG